MSSKVIVVGSANMDYVVRADALPGPGETLLGQSLRTFPGGKGSNQAVAAARLGADVVFVGAVGDDADGARMLRDLQADGVDTSEIDVRDDVATGIAQVTLLPGGENSILVVPGANAAVEPARAVAAVRRHLRTDSIVVLQGEVPHPVVEAVGLDAASAGASVIVNLAPFFTPSDELLSVLDPLVVNQHEASDLLGERIDGVDGALDAATRLADRARSVVITLGGDGAVWARDGRSGHVAAVRVETVVDTTGAGDAFIGAMSTVLAGGAALEDALPVAAEVGALAVQRDGAQASYPHRSQVTSLQ